MTAVHWGGIEAQRLSTGEASLVVVPSRGAKLASLVHAGFEWLLQPAGPLRSPGPDFVASGLWGWDEMLPTIHACSVTLDGAVRRLPDHGEVWREPWEASGDGLACAGRALPYRVQRTIAVAGPCSFVMSYGLETAVREAVPVLWAAHPQLRAQQGCRVVLPEAVTEVVDVLTAGAPVRRPWPVDDVPRSGSAKVYAPPDVPVSWAGLEQPDGHWLQLRWDAEVAPYLGVWFDRAALASEPVVALEPASGFYDDLRRAVAAGRVSWVRADAPLRWRLEVEVGVGAPPWSH